MKPVLFLPLVCVLLMCACAPAVSAPATPAAVPEDSRTPLGVPPVVIETQGVDEGGGAPAEESVEMLAWENENCDRLIVTAEAVLVGRCGEQAAAVMDVTPAALERIAAWQGVYASFEAETPAGQVSFQGMGPSVPTPAEGRMMAEWAQLTYDIARSGRTGAAWGLAFTYSRSGGIAGFCDDVSVYLTGHAQVSDCQGTNARVDLTATQLEQVYAWYDAYSSIDYTYSDAQVVDALSLSLAMPAKGGLVADEATVRAIIAFADDLLAQVSFQRQADPAGLAAAETAIREFLTALNLGEFDRAAALYGGHTSVLADWNPDISDDLPAWLERGCTQNGLMCLLPRTIIYRGQGPDGELQFLVEYNQSDGTLFRLGTCCTEGLGQVRTDFKVRARQQDGLWQVLDLPPYVP